METTPLEEKNKKDPVETKEQKQARLAAELEALEKLKVEKRSEYVADIIERAGSDKGLGG